MKRRIVVVLIAVLVSWSGIVLYTYSPVPDTAEIMDMLVHQVDSGRIR